MHDGDLEPIDIGGPEYWNGFRAYLAVNYMGRLLRSLHTPH